MSPPPSRRTPLDPETLRPRGRHQRALRRRRRRKGAVVAVTAVVALAAVAGIGGTAAVVAYGSSCDLDSLKSVDIGANSFVYAADGSLLGSIPAERNREPVTAEGMSLWIRKATIAIEDRRFFEHDGVDVEGIARAAVENLRAGEIVEGGRRSRSSSYGTSTSRGSKPSSARSRRRAWRRSSIARGRSSGS